MGRGVQIEGVRQQRVGVGCGRVSSAHPAPAIAVAFGDQLERRPRDAGGRPEGEGEPRDRRAQPLFQDVAGLHDLARQLLAGEPRQLAMAEAVGADRMAPRLQLGDLEPRHQAQIGVELVRLHASLEDGPGDGVGLLVGREIDQPRTDEEKRPDIVAREDLVGGVEVGRESVVEAEKARKPSTSARRRPTLGAHRAAFEPGLCVFGGEHAVVAPQFRDEGGEGVARVAGDMVEDENSERVRVLADDDGAGRAQGPKPGQGETMVTHSFEPARLNRRPGRGRRGPDGGPAGPPSVRCPPPTRPPAGTGPRPWRA